MFFPSFSCHQDSFLAPEFLEIVRFCTSPGADLQGLLSHLESFSGKEKQHLRHTDPPGASCCQGLSGTALLCHRDVIPCPRGVSAEAAVLLWGRGCFLLSHPSLLMSHQRLQLQQGWGFACTTPHQGAWFSLPECFATADSPCWLVWAGIASA